MDRTAAVPTWTDQLEAWSTLGAAVLTLLLAVLALAAWRTARDTLHASRDASEAAKAANVQAALDSIEQTRPYVFAEVVAGLGGPGTYDVRIVNSGRSAARDLTLDYDSWPSELDDVGESVKKLFSSRRTLPPGCSLRAIWRLDGQWATDGKASGLGTTGRLSVNYTSTDPSNPSYTDDFDVMLEDSGLWPVGEEGPVPDGLKGDARKFYLLGQALVRRVSDLSR